MKWKITILTLSPVIMTFLLCLLSIEASAQIGESCHPCTKEVEKLKKEQDRLEKLKSDLVAAEQKLSDAEDAEQRAVAWYIAATGAVEVACVFTPELWRCTFALIALGKAVTDLDLAVSQRSKASAELSGIRAEIKTVKIIIGRRELELCECQGRGYRYCEKCENGIVKAEQMGVSVSDCYECDGKGGRQLKAGKVVCPDGSCSNKLYHVVKITERCSGTIVNEYDTPISPKAGTTGKLTKHYDSGGNVTYCEGETVSITVTDNSCP